MGMAAEAGVWSSFPERGWRDKEKKGAGDGALGGFQFEGIRRGQRREQPEMASLCFQALVPMPGVRSSRDGGLCRAIWERRTNWDLGLPDLEADDLPGR